MPHPLYIQFGDQKLRLTQMATLGLSSPPVELLVLSTCQTALGNRQVEWVFLDWLCKRESAPPWPASGASATPEPLP